MTAGMDFRLSATMRLRTSEWPCWVHLHTVLGPVSALKASPRVRLSSCSTRGVQEPQEAEALVPGRPPAGVGAPGAVAGGIPPLQAALAAENSGGSAMAATAALGSRPRRPSVIAWPN